MLNFSVICDKNLIDSTDYMPLKFYDTKLLRQSSKDSGNVHNIKGLLYAERVFYRKLGWIRCLVFFVCLFFKIFFLMWNISKVVLNVLQYCFCFMFWLLAARHVVSQLPDQGSDTQYLHWKVKTKATGPPGKSLMLCGFLFVCLFLSNFFHNKN